MKSSFSLGIDFGTNSVRALVVRCKDGREFGSAVVGYPSGKQGILLNSADPLLARQNPGDYMPSLAKAVRAAITKSSESREFRAENIVGIGVDTTGSSPIPVDAKNRPLALQSQWKRNLNAQCWLWKDHTSWKEAALITGTAAEMRPGFIAKCGNTYSSEWFWSKILHCLKVDPDVFHAAASWVEFSDWVPSVLAGVNSPDQVVRGICAAGHKALYSEDWGGLPDQEFLRTLDPALAGLRSRLYAKAYDAGTASGLLCDTWAEKLGLQAGIQIAIGEFDVHYGAIGCGVAEGTLVKVIGTSTCDCGVVPMTKKVADIPGICGIVPGAILPGFFGIEAGQSAVGDIFKWWVEGICGDGSLFPKLEKEALKLKPGQSGLLALDWNNGNRTILVDPMLTGLTIGTTLHTTRAEMHRALIEATAFGARSIIERIEEYGVPVKRIVCAGGIAEKSPLLMQIYADVTGRTMLVAGSSQACALGGAVTAAVLAGQHRSFAAAQKAMTSLKDIAYKPITANRKVYDQLYKLYLDVHNAFGGVRKDVDLSHVMKSLISIRQSAS